MPNMMLNQLTASRSRPRSRGSTTCRGVPASRIGPDIDGQYLACLTPCCVAAHTMRRPGHATEDSMVAAM